MTSNFTPEQRARIAQFETLVQDATRQTGVVYVTTMKTQTMRLSDGTPRTEITAIIETAIMANWQPPKQPEDRMILDGIDNETPTPDPVSANGAHAE